MRPIRRIVAKHKKSGKIYRVGTVWPAPFEGAANVKPVTEPDSRYNEKSFSEVLENLDKYYINEYDCDREERARSGFEPEDEEEDF